MSELVEVALLGKTVGLKGFVRLHNRGDFPNQFKKNAIFYDGDGNELVVKNHNSTNDTIVFCGFEDVDSAKTLTNKTIYTTKEETRKNCKLKKGEFFYFDVIGCEIYENNQRLGEVEDIDEVGANHLFLVKTDGNLISKGLEKNFYILYIDVYIEKVDVENKKIYTKNAILILENS